MRTRAGLILLVIGAILPGGASGERSSGEVRAAQVPAKAVRLVFAGDVSLRHDTEAAVRADPGGLFAGVRFEISSADLAVAGVDVTPPAAQVLGPAGFDSVVVAGDRSSGAARTLEGAGITPVGTGTSARRAAARIVPAGGLRVALVAFDTAAPAREAIESVRRKADLVVVALRESSRRPAETDPSRLVRRLASWGADVVWISGSQRVGPVRLIASRPGGRPAIVATGLGSLISGRLGSGTSRGALLEVLAGAGGVRAFRVGQTTAEAAGATFAGWKAPRSDAVALDGGWWTLAQPVKPVRTRYPRSLAGLETKGEVTAAAVGDAEGNGGREIVASFRRPFRSTPVNALVPKRLLIDRHGLTAHVGLYRPADLRPIWVAGTVLRPVQRLAVCYGALAVAYSTLDDRSIAGTGAWRWSGFGFTQLPDLAGQGTPACADVDGDGRLDPLILERSSR